MGFKYREVKAGVMKEIQVDYECACKFGFIRVKETSEENALIEVYEKLKKKRCGEKCKPKLEIGK